MPLRKRPGQKTVRETRNVVRAHLLAEEVKTVDDAAQRLAQSRSLFVRKAAVAKARRMLAHLKQSA